MKLLDGKPEPYYWVKLATLFVVYFITALLGLEVDAISGFASIVWPPTGIAFTALFLFGLRLWPAVTLAALLVNYIHGAPILVAVGIALGNTLEALVGSYFFKKLVKHQNALEKVRDVVVLVLVVSFGSTLLSATIGTSSLFLGGIIQKETFGPTFRAWWFGDFISNLVLSPAFLIWSKFPKFEFKWARLFEGCALGISVLVLCFIVFSPWLDEGTREYFRTYWMFLLLTWTTLRFGQHANILFVMAVSVIAVWGTLNGYGPFQATKMLNSLFQLQLFICAVSVCGLFFGALGIEKQEALRTRNDFISIASHELRTPITSLKLQIHVLKSGLPKNDLNPEDEKILRIINVSDQQLDKLNVLVDNLLDITQIETGSLNLEMKEMNLTSLIQDVTLNSREYLNRANCIIALNLAPDIIGKWNHYRIEQVVSNLLMNSIKYGAGKPIKIELTKNQNSAVISIHDNGIGISREDQNRIFEKYERVKSSHNIKGFGLGLYICKQIVEAHHGKITVESSLNQGSVFRVELPFA